jgi:hypothetical protein
MSLFDSLENKGLESEENIIRRHFIAQSLHQSQNQHSYKMFVNTDDIELMQRFKTTSLLHMLTFVSEEHLEKLMKLGNGKIAEQEEYISKMLSNVSIRYMLPAVHTIHNITIEALAQVILHDGDMLDRFKGLIAELYPKFFKKGQQPVEAIINFMYGKKWKSKKFAQNDPNKYVGIELSYGEVACLKFLIGWYDVDMSEPIVKWFCKEIMSNYEEQNMYAEREVCTSYDFLAKQLGIAPEEFVEDKIFLKYSNRCMAVVAEWLSESIKNNEALLMMFPKLEDYKENHLEYIKKVFNFELLKLQDINSEYQNMSAELFGRNPLSFITNILAENKWFLREKTVEHHEIAFRMALFSVCSSNAIVNFMGEFEKLEKVNLIRNTSVNPGEIAVILYAAYAINLISIEYKLKDIECNDIITKCSQTDSRGTKSWVHPRITDLETELMQLKEQIKEKDRTISRQHNQIENLERSSGDVKKLIRENAQTYEVEIRQLNLANKKLTATIEDYDKRIQEQDVLLEAYEQAVARKECVQADASYTDEEINDQSILFVGGRYELIRKLKEMLPKAKFYTTVTEPMPDIRKIDRIVYFSRFIDHSTYNKIFDKAKLLSIPFLFIHTQNHDQIMGIIKQKQFEIAME